YYKAKTDPNLLLQAGMHHIGTGPRKVFLDNFGLSFYYAGRNLGWHMYSPDTSFAGGKPFAEDLQKLLPEVDYAIIYSENTFLRTQLEQAGFHRTFRIGSPNLESNYPIELALEISPYGPYLFYARKPGPPVRLVKSIDNATFK
ncbi:MAG: hypothetical protein K1Y36_21410, partial [Blastocatellia bacterium]|nr:hypothetical protein [Blastocatellia bacterium]